MVDAHSSSTSTNTNATMASPPSSSSSSSPRPWSLPLLPPSRRSSSVSSATTVAAMRTAAFRGRAVHSADEKRVTFRATPSVRYFNSTHSASFGSDALDDDAAHDADAQQHPQWRALRMRRSRQQLKPCAVAHEAVDAMDEQRAQLVLKVAETARQRMEASVSHLLDTAAGWTKRSGSKLPTWERRIGTTHEVVIRVSLPCRFRELRRVLETTTQSDELDAALFACVHERIDRVALLETIETTTAAIREGQRERSTSETATTTTPSTMPMTTAIKRVLLPRSKLDEAAEAWRRVRQEEPTAVREPERLELIDVELTTASFVSRTLQQLAPHAGDDRMLVGEMQIGYVLRPDQERPSEQTTVAMFLSRTRKASTSFGFLGTTVSDTLIARLREVSTVLWRYIERRRFGCQILAYPDTVYCVDDIAAVQADVTACPLCATAFGFRWRRHFCHVCALWVCIKCSADTEVETDREGWTMDTVKICSACRGRVHECVFDYDRGAAHPSEPMISTVLESEGWQSSRRLAASWIQRLQKASGDRDRQAHTVVLDTLTTMLSPDEECNLRLSDLQVDWEDLAPDEMSEPVDELAEVLPIPVLTRRQCVISHDASQRQYVLLFDDESGIPQSPTTEDDADRVQRVEKLALVGLSSHPTLDALCALAATALRCRMVFVSAILTDRVRRLSKLGTLVSEHDRDDGFCAYTLQSIHPLVVLDMARDIRSRFFSLTTEEHARFYCGVPLLSPDETFVMATFAAVDTRPSAALTTSDYSMFIVLARAARSLLMRELEEQAQTPAFAA